MDKRKITWIIIGILVLTMFFVLKETKKVRLSPSTESGDDPFLWVFKNVLAPAIDYWLPAKVKYSGDCTDYPTGYVRSCSYSDSSIIGIVCEGGVWTRKTCDDICLSAGDSSNGIGMCKAKVVE